jgi:hypothetical protein
MSSFLFLLKGKNKLGSPDKMCHFIIKIIVVMVMLEITYQLASNGFEPKLKIISGVEITSLLL